MRLTWARIRYAFGGVLPIGAHWEVGAWPLVWLRPKLYRFRDGSAHWPLGPLRFIWVVTHEEPGDEEEASVCGE